MKGNGNSRGSPRRIPEVLSLDDQARLLAQLDLSDSSGIRARAILRLLLDTGLRASELINLQVRDLDFSSGRLWVRQGKGRKDRGLFFNGQCGEVMQAWLAVRLSSGSAHLFTSLDGRKPICGRWLRRFVKQLGEKIGAPWLHVHSLRHCFGSDLLAKTRNLVLVQQAMGHASIQTTTIYTHISQPELEAALKNLREGE